jgi:hypothetical protein
MYVTTSNLIVSNPIGGDLIAFGESISIHSNISKDFM